MSNRVGALKPLLLAAGLAALLPALGSAQAPGMNRKAGMWQTTMSLNGQQIMTMDMCTDQATEQHYSVVNPQPGRGGGASNCTGMTPTPAPGGYRIEGTCTNGGRKSHVVATIKGSFDTAYSMDVATDVDGKASPPIHMDAKWTGACPAGRKPGDMVMPGGTVVNVNAATGAGAGGR
jgi:hypothetical protein